MERRLGAGSSDRTIRSAYTLHYSCGGQQRWHANSPGCISSLTACRRAARLPRRFSLQHATSMHADLPAYQGCVHTDISSPASKHTSVCLTLEKSKKRNSVYCLKLVVLLQPTPVRCQVSLCFVEVAAEVFLFFFYFSLTAMSRCTHTHTHKRVCSRGRVLHKHTLPLSCTEHRMHQTNPHTHCPMSFCSSF